MVTVGSPLTAPLEDQGLCNESKGCSNGLVKLSEPGAQASSPIDGTIVRWRMKGTTAGPGYNLSVLHANGGGSYTVTANSGSVTSSGGAIETFPTDLPIHVGEFLDLNLARKGRVDFLKSPSTEVVFIPPLALGQTGTAFEEFEGPTEVAVNADVQPPPTLAALSPAHGSVMGGTSVTITGSDLEGASAVSFGTTPAKSFAVTNEGQITAIAPASKTLTEVPVTVTTIAGTAASPSTFFYQGCRVPNLKGKKLKAAKKKLKAADCTLGKVTGQKSKSAKVTKQSPKPGKVLAPGAKISLKVHG